MKTNRFCSDNVHQRASLHSRKHRGVDLFGELRRAHDDSAARAAQTFVRCRRDEMRVRQGRGMLAARNESGNVRHVDEQ